MLGYADANPTYGIKVILAFSFLEYPATCGGVVIFLQPAATLALRMQLFCGGG